MRVLRATSAKADLDSITDYFGQRNPVAALAMLDRIATAQALLETHPLIGHPGRISGTRELVVTGTPFILVYAVADNALTVMRVLHSQQQWPPA